MINHYRTLGVDPQAEAVAIRSAYLALIRRHHPDKGGAEADPARAQAVTAAWEVLRHPGRRAAYDEARQARFQPEGGMVGPAVHSRKPRIRGGAAGRNLFLLLAAGTVGLCWWAFRPPRAAMPPTVMAEAPKADEFVRPPIARNRDEEPTGVGQRVQPTGTLPLPQGREERNARPPVIRPPLPIAEPARGAMRTVEAPDQARSQPAVEGGLPVAVAPLEEPRSAVAAAPAVPGIDLAPLERHLQLLTDQSLQFGTEAKRSRLLATRETFLARLRACDSDACKRDTYLRRNAEVAEIMRN
jgi:hypothetical protein